MMRSDDPPPAPPPVNPVVQTIVIAAVTAACTAAATKLAEWGVEQLRARVTPPKKDGES